MKKFAIAIFILSSFMILFSAENEISYEDYMSHIKTNLPQIRSDNMDTEISKLEVKRAKAFTDLELSGGIEYSYDEPLSSSAAYNHTSGTTSYAGVSKTFAATGTQLESQINYSANRISAEPESYNSYQPSVTFSVRQPVMKNFLGTLDRYAIENARIDYEIQQAREQTQRRAYTYTYSYLYMQWCALHRTMNLGKRNVSNAYSLYQQTKRKMESRIAENDDVQQSYSSYLGYKMTDNSNMNSYNQIYYQISELLSLKDIKPEFSAFEKQYAKASEAAFDSIPFEATASYRELKKTLESFQLSLKYSQNSQLPQFDVVAGIGKKDDLEDFSSSMTSLDKTEYSAGIEISYPLGNTDADSGEKINRLQIKQLSEQLKSDIQNYNSEMLYTIEAAAQVKNTIVLRTRNLRALRSQLATETRKYGQARITLSTLLDTKNKIANEEASLIQNKLELISLYNSYLQLTI